MPKNAKFTTTPVSFLTGKCGQTPDHPETAVLPERGESSGLDLKLVLFLLRASGHQFNPAIDGRFATWLPEKVRK